MKATRLCNLRCTYCHEWRSGPNQTMNFNVLAKTISSALRDEDHNYVHFIWHGGEPTVLPISFYKKVLLIQSYFQRPGQIIENTIQTNGTHLTPTWVRYLRENKFGIGISLDGPPEIHDRSRRYASGKPSFEDVAQSIELLRKHGIPVSILMVIDEDVLSIGPDRVFDFFLEMKINHYGLIPAKPYNQPNAAQNTPTKHYVNPKAMTEFLIRMYDRWKEQGDPNICIREIDAILRRFKGKLSSCQLEGGCLGNYYVVEPNGEIGHCDLFIGDQQYYFGNILERDFSAIQEDDKMHALIDANNRDLEAMQGCPYFKICNGWCPHERYLSFRHNSYHNSKCCGLFDLIEHIRKNPPN